MKTTPEQLDPAAPVLDDDDYRPPDEAYRHDLEEELKQQIAAEDAYVAEYEAEHYAAIFDSDDSFTDLGESAEILNATFGPDRTLVTGLATLMIGGDAEKMREYVAYLNHLRAIGVLSKVRALLDQEVRALVNRHRSLEITTAELLAPAASLSTNPFVFERGSALLNRPRPSWLVDGILTEDSLAVLFGPPNVGKSFLAMDWALSITHGYEWQRRETARGAVGYIAAEGSHGLGPRLAAWRQEHGCSRDEMRHEDFFFLGAAPDLLDKDALFQLVMATYALPRLRLIIVDTMARTLVGGDENSAKDVGVFVRNIDVLRRATGAAILVIHHTTKAEDSIRGSTALVGAADTVVRLSRIKGTDDGLLLESAKMKDARAFDALTLQRATIDLGNGETSCVIRKGAPSPFPQADARAIAAPDPLLRGVLQALNNAGPAGLSYTRWEAAAAIRGASFSRAVKTLKDGGHVAKAGGRQSPYRITDKESELLNNAPGAVDVSHPVANPD